MKPDRVVRDSIGVDPGSRRTGWAVVRQDSAGRFSLLGAGRIAMGSQRLEQRLGDLCARMQEVLALWSPSVAVIETGYLGVNPKHELVLAEARGVLRAQLGQHCPLLEFTPKQVKLRVSGSGSATKAAVQQAVLMLLGCPQSELLQHDDCSDAAAIAVCGLLTPQALLQV